METKKSLPTMNLYSVTCCSKESPTSIELVTISVVAKNATIAKELIGNLYKLRAVPYRNTGIKPILLQKDVLVAL